MSPTPVGVIFNSDKIAPIKPADTLADMPIIKAFIVRNPSGGSEHIEDFYKNYMPIKLLS